MTYTLTIKVYDIPTEEKAREMEKAMLDAYMDVDADADCGATAIIKEDDNA